VTTVSTPAIAFNISALSLQHLDFPDLVERLCRALGVPTDRLGTRS
jgi:EAL domain-containing protein (putative c-di-GMP-specific phosphodiesterase class I)